MAVRVNFQDVVDKYAVALQVPRLLFDLWPSPRPVGRPGRKYSALPAATTLAVIGAFEGFAEDLLAGALVEQGRSWAHVAKNADLTNPSLATLVEKLGYAAGISSAPATTWTITLPRQTAATAWADRATSWAEVLERSAGWVQVRHCLAHGLVTGLGPEVWPAPVSARPLANQGNLPSANDPNVLATIRGFPDKRALYFWPAVAAARIYSIGAGVVATEVARAFGETVDVTGLDLFSTV
ncbi:hypothetical protein [Microbacterium flavum]|uniref:Uncharacterized protein n=1 Tax=Microbacterium flavum TaxID=415216 RepID=A0ABS5XSI1_9MICO|nr:hypothetical protein [Microbacterium flavum]MBT8797490.1 hypothetical protein [Microbacterium flavum]